MAHKIEVKVVNDDERYDRHMDMDELDELTLNMDSPHWHELMMKGDPESYERTDY